MMRAAILLASCLLAAVAPSLAQAQQTAPATLTMPIQQALALEAGTGRLVQLPGPATTVMAADPRVARVQPASATTLFIMAVAPGRTSIVATNTDGSPVATYDVVVKESPAAAKASAAPVNPLEALMGGGKQKAPPVEPAVVEAAVHRLLIGAEGVKIAGAADVVEIRGEVATPELAQQVVAVVRSFTGEGRQLVNNLRVLSKIQVNLRVRIVEMSREIIRELGINWQALLSSGGFKLGFITSGIGAPAVDTLNQVLTNLGARAASSVATLPPARFGAGYSSGSFDINAIIDALEEDRLITVLAEPNLTAQSGETASFLAGGEFPIPVSTTDTGQITIVFKPFGVSLSFVPTVLTPQRLNLHVRPEVSDLSDNGAVNIPIGNGLPPVHIPALTVRRAETTVELGSGQSFAIAGLLQNTASQLTSGVLGLDELPVLGPLFKSNSFKRNASELVIIITPYLVEPVSDPGILRTPLDDYRAPTDLERILESRQTSAHEPAAPPLQPIDAGFILD